MALYRNCARAMVYPWDLQMFAVHNLTFYHPPHVQGCSGTHLVQSHIFYMVNIRLNFLGFLCSAAFLFCSRTVFGCGTNAAQLCTKMHKGAQKGVEWNVEIASVRDWGHTGSQGIDESALRFGRSHNC